MKCYLRIDDFPFGTPEDRKRYDSLEALKKLSILNTHVTCALGIVPEYVTDEEINTISQMENIIPCMHGFTHGLDRWRPIDSNGGEFFNLTIPELRDRFRKYEGFINQLKPYVFIPPFDTYTQELVNVLPEFGFNIICGGEPTITHGMVNFTYPSNLKLVLSSVACGLTDFCNKEFIRMIEGSVFSFHLPWESCDNIQRFIDISKSNNILFRG